MGPDMGRMRSLWLVALAVVVAIAVPSGVAAADGPPDDPTADTIGWESGTWYNESIDVDASDGLDADERSAVVSRTMARVEYVRGIEFERRPPVRTITRADHRADTSENFENVSREERILDNVIGEALFLVGESTDVVAIQKRHYSGNVQGYYDPGEEAITLVSDNETDPKVDEITLAQELYHALQDQHFDVPSAAESTTEANNARNAVVEGDGNYVDYLYERHCEGAWNGTCLQPARESSGSDDAASPHIGLYQIQYFPYSSGPAFVRHQRRSGGWDAVDALYDDPPASTEQVIHPDRFGTDAPTNVTIDDRSDETWTRLNRTNATDYDAVGEAGWFVSMWYPGYETGGEREVIPRAEHLRINESTGEVDGLAPYAYAHRYSAGWDGDRIRPYVSDAAETNETGYVAKLVWDSPSEASEFLSGYRELLDVRGGQRVVGYEGVYRIPDGAFADAFAVEQNGSTVRIVNAPTIDALESVRAGSVREVPVTGTAERGDLEPMTDDTGVFGPGPGPLVALVVVVFVATGLARRRR